MVDSQLDNSLADFVATGSHDAFARLVRRHIDAVYAQCIRRLRDPALADDVTQSVFIVLAQRASRLPPGTVLAGWLYVVAQHACMNARRSATRRRIHEHKAAQMTQSAEETVSPSRDEIWLRVEATLDDAMADLGGPQRDALVLRYLEGRSIAEVGAALSISDDAAKQRVSRALRQLRKRLAHRGVVVPALALPGLLGTHSVIAAPSGLAATVIIASLSNVAVTTPSLIAQGVIKTMAHTQLRSMALTMLLTLALISTTLLVVGAAVFRVDPLRAIAPLTISVSAEAPADPWDAGVTLPDALVGIWEPVDATKTVHREDEAVVRLVNLTLGKTGRITMTAARTSGTFVSHKTIVMATRAIDTDRDPRTITTIVTPENQNDEGQIAEAVGQETTWAYAVLADGTLRVAIPTDGAPMPETLDEGEGREVFVLKRKAPPATRP